MHTESFTLYSLRFDGLLHIGDNRDDYGTSLRSVSSDSMYAALTSTLAKLGIEIPSNGDLGCVISALFPYYKESSDTLPVYFFPRPFSLSSMRTNKELAIDAKAIKKVRWLDLHYFEKVLNGEDVFESDSLTGCVKEEYLTNSSIDNHFVCSEVKERVSVSRSFDDSKPFFMERLFFKGESGLFFLAKGDTDLVDQALPLLSVEGIGTDRNIGNGTFKFEKKSIDISVPEETGYGLSLSSFIPENKSQLDSSLAGSSCAYDFTRCGGWITTPPYLSIRKNAIYAFSPGSVLGKITSGNGRIVNLAPANMIKHPVWRCGKALILPITLN